MQHVVQARPPEYQRMSRVSGGAGISAGAERSGGGAGRESRHGSRVRDRFGDQVGSQGESRGCKRCVGLSRERVKQFNLSATRRYQNTPYIYTSYIQYIYLFIYFINIYIYIYLEGGEEE